MLLTVWLSWGLEELDESLRLLDGPDGSESAQLESALVNGAGSNSRTEGSLRLLQPKSTSRRAHLRDIASCDGILELLGRQHVPVEHDRWCALVRRLLLLQRLEGLIHFILFN